MENSIFFYLIIINIIGFLSMFIDKEKAKRKQWRISEKALISIAILGGSIGTWVGMQSFRHKTKHKKFTIGIPVIIVIQLILIPFFYKDFSSIVESLYYWLNSL